MNRRAISLSIVCPVAVLLAAGTVQGQNTERVSVAANSATLANAAAQVGHTTPDGRWAVFTSNASNLVGGDTLGHTDVFVRDRWTNNTVRISVPTTGLGAEANGGSALAGAGARVISDDGRFVIFESTADNLVSSDTNEVSDIFVRDRDLDGNGVMDEPGAGMTRTVRVNLTTGNAQAIGGCPNQTCTHYSNRGIISADGRYVAWTSPYNFSSDSAAFTNVFWRDRDTDNDGAFDESGAVETRLVSKRISASFVGQSGDGLSDQPSMSADGRFIAFRSTSRFMVFSDNTANDEIFVRDITSSAMTRITLPIGGGQPDGVNNSPSISASGRFVAFASGADNLATGAGTTGLNILVADRDTDTDGVLDETGAVSFQSVSKYRAPLVLPGQDPLANLNGSSASPTISDDGRWVCFASTADNFGQCLVIPGNPVNPTCTDSTAFNEVFVYDRGIDDLARASLGRTSTEPDAHCEAPTMSPNGRWVTFRSAATNLDLNDTPGLNDIYVRTMYAAANDACADALPATPGSAVFGDTYGAAAEGATSCGGAAGAAVWYSFVAACDGTITVDTAGSVFDTVLTVYQGACPATAEKIVACNDDVVTGNLTSLVNVDVTAGQTYMVRVGSYGTDSGHFRMYMTPCDADCPADFNQSGAVSVQDIFDFLAAYFAGIASADFNQSGAVSVQDIFDYLAAYFAGCP